jgi:hypothetical protein
MDRDPFDLDSFETSLNGFRDKLKKANDAKKANPCQTQDADSEEDQASYTDLDETTSDTHEVRISTVSGASSFSRQAIKIAISF